MYLTHTTEEIMNYLWKHEDGLSFRKIYDHFTLECGKEWKRQTLYTHLTILADKGFINIEGTRRRMIYYPAVSLEDYRQDYANNVVTKTYDGSLKKFVAAFTGQQALNTEEAKELIELVQSRTKE